MKHKRPVRGDWIEYCFKGSMQPNCIAVVENIDNADVGRFEGMCIAYITSRLPDSFYTFYGHMNRIEKVLTNEEAAPYKGLIAAMELCEK